MLNDRLLQFRKKKGLSQQEVAEYLNITRQTVSNWECGQGSPSLDKAKELCTLFNVSLDDLIGNDIEVISPIINRTVLNSLIGKICILDCSDAYFIFDNGSKVKVIDVNEDWLKVEYIRRKDNFKGKEKVLKLIDMSLVNGFEIVGDDNE